MASERLSDTYVKKNDLKSGLHCDGKGLYLQVTPRTPTDDDKRKINKSWLFRFMLCGRARKMGLGDYPSVSLKQAREKARQARSLKVDGRDPIEERNGRRAALAAETASQMTFRECALGYISAHQHGWKSAKHSLQWAATLETYAFPIIGALPVGAIDRAHVMKILEPLWLTRTETASRLQKVLDCAKVLGLRTGENPAAWRGNLDHLLPKKSTVAPVAHHAAIPYRDLPVFMAKLRQHDSVAALALEWTILCAARTADTIGARWSEIDREQRLWTIEAARMKARRTHTVPLSVRALAILDKMDELREGDFIFPGAIAGRGLGRLVMDRVLKDLGHSETVHGFRSAFKDWASEETTYPNEMSEMALAHAISNKVEAAYRRLDMREKRRALMQDWSNYCSAC